jgi:hypothetical protein
VRQHRPTPVGTRGCAFRLLPLVSGKWHPLFETAGRFIVKGIPPMRLRAWASHPSPPVKDQRDFGSSHLTRFARQPANPVNTAHGRPSFRRSTHHSTAMGLTLNNYTDALNLSNKSWGKIGKICKAQDAPPLNKGQWAVGSGQRTAQRDRPYLGQVAKGSRRGVERRKQLAVVEWKMDTSKSNTDTFSHWLSVEAGGAAAPPYFFRRR